MARRVAEADAKYGTRNVELPPAVEAGAGCGAGGADFGIRAGCTGAAIGGDLATGGDLTSMRDVASGIVVEVRTRACFQADMRLAISAATSGPERREMSNGLRSSKVAGGFAFSPELMIRCAPFQLRPPTHGG